MGTPASERGPVWPGAGTDATSTSSVQASGGQGLLPVELLLGLEDERGRVDAVAQARGARPIIEDVAQVGAAALARHLGAGPEGGAVLVLGEVAGQDGGPEAGPAGARVVLRLGGEEGEAAPGAAVETGGMVV